MNIKKKAPMPLFQKVFYFFSFCFLIGAFIYLGTKDFNLPKKTLTNQENFTKEYGITANNLYQYKTAREVLELLNTGSGILFLAYPENKWSATIAELLNDVAKKYGVKEIYYYNFKLDRGNHNHYYENIVRQLTPYLQIVEDETLQLYAPTVIMVQNGNILYYDDETTIVRGDSSVEDYWTYLNTERKRKDYAQAIERYQYESTGKI